MVVTCQQMQSAEARLFADGTPAEPQMNQAGHRCAEAIRKTESEPGRATLFCGSGNNGGDALVVGTWLRKWGWQVGVKFSHPPVNRTELSRKKLREFEAVPDGAGGECRILVDGLLGIGAKGALRDSVSELAAEMNRIREEESARTFAIDIPSGVDGDTGEIYGGAVKADHTLTICVPKQGLLSERSINHVGRLHLIPLPEIPVEEGDSSLTLLCPETLHSCFPTREFDTHKGKAGRVTIVAGSRGLTGAAVLSSLGALHSGAGLVSVFVPEEIYTIVASQAPVDVMVRPYGQSIEQIVNHPADVMAIGPGLGSEVNNELLEFAAAGDTKMVLDADMLNWLASKPDLLSGFPAGKRVLTPHPGELARLSSIEGDRINTARTLAEKWNVTLLYKGARTVIATPGTFTTVNSTGTPSMASGGMGDVLTGMVASLAAQGLSLHNAAGAGSWALGRAAELTPKAVTARKVAETLGTALQEL
ncbi:MAG: NAD(P)H-hydrate dehydratase [Verrucomicrobiales bacterium]|nr:NAD(P)H-hydrate dehydratase [Verrucomicrobiales bacterium]